MTTEIRRFFTNGIVVD